MLRSAAQELTRLRQITAVIGKYGYAEWVHRSPDLPEEIGTGDFGARPDSSTKSGPSPKRFRQMLEELGPTFIKFGQVLSTRPDFVSREFVEELKSLQDHCEALPFASIKKAIEDGLGRPVEEAFVSLESEPMATASIAQVHRGVTRAGRRVVIKVQRPDIADEVRRDVDLLYRLARLLDAVVEESALAEPVGIVREFDLALAQELNFQVEANNMREFARLHAARKDIVVPEVLPELSSTTVLTMSELEGSPLSRLPADADKKAIAKRIIQEAFDEVFIDGVFHADPHPGNLMYLGDDRYGILDFGLIGRLSPDMRDTLVVLALAVSVRDADTVARTLYRLGQADERVNLADVRSDTVDLFDRYLGRSIQDVNSTVLTQEILNLGMKHRLRIPAEYTMLGRAGATIEGLVRELDPDIDVTEVARPYAEKLLMNRVAPDNMQEGLYRTLLQFQGLSQDVPLQVTQILSDLSSGRFAVDVAGAQMENLRSSILVAATTVAGSILGGAFVIGSFIGMAQLDWQIYGVPLVGAVGALVGVIVMSWVGAYVVLRPRLKKISLLRLFARKRG